jgi:hypothetical protein
LKKGWRTLPSVDFARYSISASRDGYTQTPRCAIFLAWLCFADQRLKDLSDVKIKPVLELKHHEIAELTEQHGAFRGVV